MIFFIFMVSNMGGCLTPIGDPPLLMGFMRGVPFFWSLHLLPVLLFNMVIMLLVFYHVDKLAYRKDIAQGRKPDISKPGTEFHIEGLHNIIFLVMIETAASYIIHNAVKICRHLKTACYLNLRFDQSQKCCRKYII